jgi:hypothetical protein
MKLVSTETIAKMYGVSRQAVVNWKTRYPNFPNVYDPELPGKIYLLSDIEKWYKDTMADSVQHKTKRSN